MDKIIELKGVWFLPNHKENSFTGTFHYNRKEGSFLVMMGAFENVMIPPFPEHQIIHGETIGGGDITLFECFITSSQSNLDNVMEVKYFANYVLIGHHFAQLEDLQFSSIRASIADLEEWVNIYGFEKLKSNLVEKTLDLTYKKPNNLTFKATDKIDVNFEFEYTFPFFRDVKKVEVSQTTFICLKLKNALSLDELYNPFFVLYRFLTFAYYDSPHILSIKLTHASIKKIVGEAKLKVPLQVDLLYSDNFFNKSYKKGRVLQKALFTYSVVKEQFPKMISNWFLLYQRVGSAINLFNELLLKREHSVEIKFLTAIQAMETFHRNLYICHEVPTELHNERLNAIYNNVPEHLKEWLKSKLTFSNEISLRKRLKDLYNRIPKEVTRKLINNEKNFIDEVINTRNYYTHYDSKLKKKIMSVEDTSRAAEKLKILLVCLLLNELELDNEKILQIVQVNKFYY